LIVLNYFGSPAERLSPGGCSPGVCGCRVSHAGLVEVEVEVMMMMMGFF